MCIEHKNSKILQFCLFWTLWRAFLANCLLMLVNNERQSILQCHVDSQKSQSAPEIEPMVDTASSLPYHLLQELQPHLQLAADYTLRSNA